MQEAWQAVLSHITEPISINDNFFKVWQCLILFFSSADCPIGCTPPATAYSSCRQVAQKCYAAALFSAQLGGNSLQAGAIASRLRAALALEHDVPAAWLFVHQTIELLAEQISRSMLAADVPQLAPLRPSVSQKLARRGAALHGIAPLSFQQVRAA